MRPRHEHLSGVPLELISALGGAFAVEHEARITNRYHSDIRIFAYRAADATRAVSWHPVGCVIAAGTSLAYGLNQGKDERFQVLIHKDGGASVGLFGYSAMHAARSTKGRRDNIYYKGGCWLIKQGEELVVEKIKPKWARRSRYVIRLKDARSEKVLESEFVSIDLPGDETYFKSAHADVRLKVWGPGALTGRINTVYADFPLNVGDFSEKQDSRNIQIFVGGQPKADLKDVIKKYRMVEINQHGEVAITWRAAKFKCDHGNAQLVIWGPGSSLTGGYTEHATVQLKRGDKFLEKHEPRNIQVVVDGKAVEDFKDVVKNVELVHIKKNGDRAVTWRT